MIELLGWLAAGLAAAGWVAVSALAVRRLLVDRAERRRLEAERRLHGLALALLDGENVDLVALDEEESAALARVVGRFGRSLRGVSSKRIGTFFERQGELYRQLDRLESGRPWRRATAAFALGDMQSPRTVAGLRSALDDPDREVRAAAARSLGRLGEPTAVGPLVQAFAERRLPRAVVGQALLGIGGAALPVLRRLVADPAADARSLAIELVGLLGDASDGAVVADRLRDSSAAVRANAARALGRLGAEDGTAELRARLADRVPFVRTAVADALGVVGDATAVPELLEAARTDAFDPARAAARAAARLDPARVRAAAAELHAGPHIHEAADLLRAAA